MGPPWPSQARGLIRPDGTHGAMSIQVEGLTKRYAGVAVVSRVSLEIAEGEMFVLLVLPPKSSGTSERDVV
jgi:ABC-type transporter Mla maintaining outer membrane lipid asymmetry ATPase subunit MlaF